MADTLEQTDVKHEHLQGKVTFHEPDGGWSVEAYEQKLGEYVAVRGRAPQSVTMHPDTAAALDLDDGNADPLANEEHPVSGHLPRLRPRHDHAVLLIDRSGVNPNFKGRCSS